MSAKPYKVIFGLLTLSVIFILVLQGFWIHSFYIQKQEEFSKSIYSALEDVTVKLRERDNLAIMKKTISYDPGFRTQPNLSGKPMASTTNLQVQVRNQRTEVTEITATDVKGLKADMSLVINKDSAVFKIIHADSSRKIKKIISGSTNTDNAEMQKLLDKMITEIRIDDTDERNPDTLKQVIKRVFQNKGMFLPFEFALKKVFKNNDQTLAKSKGYKPGFPSFISDLSANNVFSTHNFLFVQFPRQNAYVFSSIKNMLMLSIIFSLIILGSFYYTVRLILNQKKIGEIKTDFVNNMTHELKTPIATNSIAIDALANPLIKNDEEKFKEYIRILREENKKLNVHVERVLQMALLDKGALMINRTFVDIIPVIKQAIDHHKLQISSQKGTINFDPLPGELVVLGDKQHLQTVFSNLLDNALKYSSEKCIISIKIEQISNEIVICFQDNGIGIEKDHWDKVFEKFYRVQGGNLHDVKGFGLGLSYVRSIMEAHDGSIDLKSKPGEGSEFIIRLKKHV
jgi:signal transduction histidine kinase